MAIDQPSAKDFMVTDQAPAAIKGFIALHQGKLYYSEILRGNLDFIQFAGDAKMAGVAEFVELPEEKFRAEYGGLNAAALSELDDESSTKKFVRDMLEDAYGQKVTDIELADYGSYGFIRMRRQGLMFPYTGNIAGTRIKQLITGTVNTLTASSNTPTFTPDARQDARIINKTTLPQGINSVRVHTERVDCPDSSADGYGTIMEVRLLYDSTQATGSLSNRLQTLGWDDMEIKKFKAMTERKGLVVIAGVTGSGKTTLLKHIVDSIAEECPYLKLMSIEDPPEYPLRGVHQIYVSTLARGADGQGALGRGQEYMDAVAGALRSDPDKLMIGEIRYKEAAAAALDAAMTGHGTFTTLHASSAIAIIMRLQALLKTVYDDPLEFLCDPSVLSGLVYQSLVPRLCDHCKLPLGMYGHCGPEEQKHLEKVIPKETYERVQRAIEARDHGGIHVKGHGCEKCGHLGFSGQTVVGEVVLADFQFLDYIRHKDRAAAFQHWQRELKGRTYVKHAHQKILAGQIDPYMTEIRMGVPLDAKQVGEA